MHERLAVLAALSVLAGCATAPAFQESAVRLPSSYGAMAAAPPVLAFPAAGTPAPAMVGTAVHYTLSDGSARFWTALGDSGLTALVTEALRTNTSVRGAEARLSGARAARRLASFDFGPTLTGSASGLRSQQSADQIPGATSQLPRRDLYDFGFDASWEVDLFGRTRRNVGAQSALTSSAAYALEDVQVSLAAEVARTYFELRGAERQLAVARRNAANQQHTVALTEDRLAAGRGTAFDTERARSVLQLTLAGIPLLDAEIKARQLRLTTLVGHGADTLLTGICAVGTLPVLPDTVDLGAPQELVHHRPDVLRAERALAANTLFIGAAQAEYLPRLSLGASAGYTATRLQSLTNAGTSRFLIGPVVSVPLDFGRTRQRVTLAETRADESRADYDAAVLQAVEETETSLVSYERSHARVAVLSGAVRSSTRAADLAQQRFEAGLTDFFQVLDAQRTLLEAENQLALAHTSASIALVAIYKSVGGAWKIR